MSQKKKSDALSKYVNIEEHKSAEGREKLLKRCVRLLEKNDGVVAIPTDTLYGIGCSPMSKNAIEKIYQIKGRSHTKPLVLTIDDSSSVKKWVECHLSQAELDLFFPGPCTLVFKRKPGVLEHLNPGCSSLGLRVPNEVFIRILCHTLRFKALVLTSANKSNGASTVDIHEFEELHPSLDLILEKGKPLASAGNRSGSTIIDLSEVGVFKILRSGVNCDSYRSILIDTLKYKEII